MNIIRNLKLSLAAIALASLAACGGGGGDTGTLRLALTDAPSIDYDAVYVTVEKVRVHQSATASESAGGWSEMTLSPAKRLNLLDLQNGVLEELGEVSLPAGTYTQLRLVLAENDATTPLANSVLPTGGTEVALKTPSGQQSGLKMKVNITILPGTMADFVIDFDAHKSVVSAGSSGQYILKPVLTVIPRLVSGVSGFVHLDLAALNFGTRVSVQRSDGTIVKATTPIVTTGEFVLAPVAEGNYTLVVTAPGRATAVITAVPVVRDAVTVINATTSRLNPPPTSSTGILGGTAPLDTLVRVLQPLTDGPTVEVAGAFVDGLGDYAYTVPVGPPQVAPYVALPGALVFAADAPVAGKYTLKASLTGFADQSVVLAPLTGGATITTPPIAFP